MVGYRNVKTGRTVLLSAPNPVMDRSARWERVDLEPEPPAGTAPAPAIPQQDPDGPFDPEAHTVAQTNAHLAECGADERERVLAAEDAGRGRRGIIAGPHSGVPL